MTTTTPTPKGSCMIAMARTTRGPARWLIALCAPAAVVVMLPSAAIAADAGTSTIVAKLAGDGAVKDVKAYAADGRSSGFDGKLPVTLGVTRSVSGSSTTLAYHVENVATQEQDVTYTDTAGKAHSAPTELQLPLVAQLGVTLPASMKDVSAPGAAITTDPDGVHHVLWQMVLFTPLGAPAQDVSLTASGTGTPSAQLRAIPVDPTSAPGVSSAAAAANQSITQDDFWQGYANGGDEGLSKLRAGMGQLVSGLELLAPGSRKLANGLGAAGDGAKKLADGTDKAKDGAGQLSAGLGKINAGQTALTAGLTLIHNGQVALTGGLTQLHDGAGALATGVGQIHDGQVALTGGLTQIHDGQTSLTGGLSQIHDGQTSLTGGLSQIHDGQGALTTGLGQLSGGLGQLAGGLPAAQAGVTQISAGVAALSAGVGSDATPQTLLNGAALIEGGLAQLRAGIRASAACTSFTLGLALNGGAAGTSPCFATTANPTGAYPAVSKIDPTPPSATTVAAAVLAGLKAKYDLVATGTDTTITPGLDQLAAGINKVHLGLSHPVGAAGPSDRGGVKEGLAAVQAGLGQVATGLGAAVAGANALSSGAAAAYAGSAKLTDGSGAALAGSQQLTDGSASALAGSQQLTDGSGKALAGSQQLADGSGKAADGAKALYAGAGKALAGSQQLAAGSGKALAGSQQLAAGSGKAYVGSQALLDGLGKLSAGQHQVAAGLPAAVDGAAQIADGLAKVLTGGTQVRDGIGQVQDGAVAPLHKQTGEAAQNARKQVAILAAAGALTAKAPGGAGASYVLDQGSFRLAAATSDSDSHTGRDVGIGVGGLLLLVLGAAGGFVSGRRRPVTAP